MYWWESSWSRSFYCTIESDSRRNEFIWYLWIWENFEWSGQRWQKGVPCQMEILWWDILATCKWFFGKWCDLRIQCKVEKINMVCKEEMRNYFCCDVCCVGCFIFFVLFCFYCVVNCEQVHLQGVLDCHSWFCWLYHFIGEQKHWTVLYVFSNCE